MKYLSIILFLLMLQNTKIFSQERKSIVDFYIKVNINYYKNLNELQQQLEKSMVNSETKLIAITKPFRNSNIGDFSSFYRLSFESNDALNLEKSLKKIVGINRVEKAIKYEFYHFPNDPKYTISADTMWHLYKIKAQGAWNLSRGSDSVTIAIIDDNFEINHPDLTNNIFINPNEIANDNLDNDNNGIIDDVNGADLSNISGNPYTNDPNFIHGTRTAGCASASTNNSIGIAGIGYNCKILPVKCTNNFNYVSHGLEAIFYAASMPNVQVINMSWGFEMFSQTMQDIIDSAMVHKDNKLVFIAAAGNTSDSMYIYPAACNNVIAVGATDKFDTKTSFSKFGSWVDIAAPGRAIYTTTLNGKFGGNNSNSSISGTSYSAPLVAGTVGLMYAINKNLTYNEILNCLLSGADSINPSYLVGNRLNAYKTLQCLCSTNTCTLGDDELKNKEDISLMIFSQNILQLRGKSTDNTHVLITDISGRICLEKSIGSSETINLDNYSRGVYIVHISNANLSQSKKNYHRIVCIFSQ